MGDAGGDADFNRVYQEQIDLGKSHEYAKAYAGKIKEGEVFARHFAVIRERRALAKQAQVKAGAPHKPAPPPPGSDEEASSSSPAADPPTAAKAPPPSDPAPTPAAAPATADEPAAAAAAAAPVRKRTPADFVFGRVLGEGSYSTVYLATEKATGVDYAAKVLDKAHIQKEKKTKYVMIEKEVFSALDHPFIVRLYYTFQDAQKLYFVLDFCENGELLTWIKKLVSFDEECTRFYVAEIVLAIEHMHSRGIIHRDLKPENILMDSNMHIKITDFGTSKQLSEVDEHANSFVGTAQYVSPELLTAKHACAASDLWALGCMLYQMLSGSVPFRAGNDYQTFKKIQALDYEIPPGFPPKGKDLVEQLLILDPTARLGCLERGGFEPLKKHPFFEGIDWEALPSTAPPTLDAYLPARNEEETPLHGKDQADDELADLMAADFMQRAGSVEIQVKRDEERKQLLEKQAAESPWHSLLPEPSELIIKTGLVDKRKGLFSKRRQLILTDGPRLVYIDPEAMEVKGEIPWSEELFPQFKNMRTFFVHTPDRTYYLDDVERTAITWVDTIQQLLRMQRVDTATTQL